MLLAIDVGNTSTGLGLFDGTDLAEHWQLSTVTARTADELVVLIRGLLAEHELASDVVTGVAVCSTVPTQLHELRAMCRRYFGGVETVFVEPGTRTGVPVLTDNPKEVGADRVVNTLAAASIYGGPCIVVDFGTATIFDAVSERGEYLGGAIAPGIEVSLEALRARGAQLQPVELARPRSVIGKSTVEALRSGVVFGFAGLVDGVVTAMSAAIGSDPDRVRVIATGPQAQLVVEESDTIDDYDPWLTLTGLRLVYERNAAAR
jgi:type III pantothenate kinase